MFRKFMRWLEERKEKKLAKKRIEEARKRDPFIYK